MSVARTLSIALTGLEGTVVEVEAQRSLGIPGISIVGLPDASTLQAKDRVRAACQHAGHPGVGQAKFIVNLTPAWMRKSGSGFDLPVAVAVLQAEGAVPSGSGEHVVHIGELSLDGSVLPVPGVLPSLLAARDAGVRWAVVPDGNADEARLVAGIEIRAVSHLANVVEMYGGAAVRPPVREALPLRTVPAAPAVDAPCFSEVHGQEQARLAAEVAAAGGHHLSLSGPPGSGKTMIASRIPTILPELTDEAALELAAIRSLTGQFRADGGLEHQPPFVSPHHTSSAAAIIGGGSGVARPGAISHAHGGILFLDEAPEFSTRVLESLREPLEQGEIRLHRSHHVTVYPARFQLVLASNPCPCGKDFGPKGSCECTPMAKRRYAARLSGPIMDRVDMRVSVPPAKPAGPAAPQPEASADIAERVRAARARQTARLAGTPYRMNADLPGPFLQERMPLTPADDAFLRHLVDRGALTMRGRDRIQRLAWTLADLHGAERPTDSHVSTALMLRGDDR